MQECASKDGNMAHSKPSIARHSNGELFAEYQIVIRSLSSRTVTFAVCSCSCGRVIKVRKKTFLRNTNCGCKKVRFGFNRDKHHELHGMWNSMLMRCFYPHDKKYKHYGARGIIVCERWRNFQNFLDDMLPRPINGTIERINNNGNYEPSNCRWATNDEQQRNKRNNFIVYYNGNAMCVAEAARALNIPDGTLRRRCALYPEYRADVSKPYIKKSCSRLGRPNKLKVRNADLKLVTIKERRLVRVK